MERTDAEVLSAAPVAVVLGGKEYRIGPQIRKWNRGFCVKCDALLVQLGGVTGKLGDVDLGHLQSVDLVAVLPVLRYLMSELGPGVLDLIYEYSAELNAAREQIEETATVDECVNALAVCVRMAFGPFVRLPGLIQEMAKGPTRRSAIPEAIPAATESGSDGTQNQ